MDMKGQETREFQVDMEHLEGFRIRSQASEYGALHGSVFYTDEPDPVGEASAPATPAMLGAAIGHCLSASLLETLKHAHVPVKSFTAHVNSVVEENENGLPRISRVEVTLNPVITDSLPRAENVSKTFEDRCTVSSSVRQGIDIRVHVNWQIG